MRTGLVAVCLLAAGCGIGARVPDGAQDASAVGLDGAQAGPDAAVEGADAASTSVEDAASPPDAAGRADAAPVVADAALVLADAALPGPDAGQSTLALPALTRLPPSLGPRFSGGVEPGDPSVCEAVAPARCWWIDAAAPAGGDGSFARPARSFEAIVGALDGTSYQQGTLASGDFLYLRGTFTAPEVDDPKHFLRLMIRRAAQTGTDERPTVIKSWRGSPRAVFDGARRASDLLVFANITGVRVANLEIRDAEGRGLVVESGTGRAIFEDLLVRGTRGDGAIGVGGGLHFWGGAGHELVVRHCHFQANDRDAFGAINNIGALSLTSDLLPPGTGTLRVYRNVFERETTGVRHKHAGNFDTEIYENLFWGGKRGVLLRSFRSNEIRDNVFLDLSESAIVSYVENTKGELRASIHHNNLFDTTRLLTDVVGLHDHPHRLDLHHNFFHGAVSGTVFAVSTESLSTVTSAGNLYVLPDGAAFSRPTDGAVTAFGPFHAGLGDTTSALRAPSTGGSDEAAHEAVYQSLAPERTAGGIGY